MNKKNTVILIIIAILVVIGLVWIFNANRVIAPENGVVQNGEIDTSDWQTYRNEELGFELKIPNTWKVSTLSSQALLQKGPTEFVAKEPIIHFLSERELEVINHSNYQGAPIGTTISVFHVGKMTLDDWISKKYLGDESLNDSQVSPVIEHKKLLITPDHEGYYLHVYGLADGAYIHALKNGEYVYTVTVFWEEAVTDPIFRAVLQSITFN